MIRLPLSALLLVSMMSTAQVYKTTDELGNVSYSDTPSGNGSSEQVEIRELNTSAPPSEMGRPAQQAAEDEPKAISYKVSITAPTNETTIPMGPGNFSLSAQITPAQGRGELLQLYMDGAPWGVPQDNPSWSLTNVFRGAHDMHVAVINTNGKELAKSAAVRVYVLRPSTNFKNRGK